MKVTHHRHEHLLCLSSEEVALLVDLCHAAAFSDHLARDSRTQRRLLRFLGEVQATLHDTAHLVWEREHRGQPHGVG